MLVENYLDRLKLDQEATRDGFGRGLVEAGKKFPEVVALTADLRESTRVQDFAEKFPERFVEIGVAEQNMLGIAAGLALSGKIPFATSLAVFSPGRSWDQLRVSVCYSKANVKVVGSHTGLSVGPDGATHQALEDIAITRVLPNLTVVVPCDSVQAEQATLAVAEHRGPVYLRLARTKSPVFTQSGSKFKIGKAEVLKEGNDLTIIATGSLVYEALVAADAVKDSVSIELINCHTIKPLDIDTILASAKKTGRVVTVEDHQIAGGLGGAVAEVLSGNHPVPITRIGVENSFGESGEPYELWQKYGLDAESLADSFRHLERT